MGDVKLAAVTGYCFGIFYTSLIIASACVIGIIFFTGSYIKKQKRKTLPFAPFVAAGFAISEIFFRRIIWKDFL